jgi:hypothetical protein
MTDRVPAKMIDARTGNYGISHLLSYFNKGSDERENYPADARWLFDTVLPPFQRSLEWDEAMMIRFIESAWMGVDIGRYVVNDAQDAPPRTFKDGSWLWHKTDRWLIDGQQRLTAISCYVQDQFAVKGADGRLWKWTDLPLVDQRKFGSIGFDRGIIKVYSEVDLRVLYDRMNFGGIAHREDQRALPEGEPENWAPESIQP